MKWVNVHKNCTVIRNLEPDSYSLIGTQAMFPSDQPSLKTEA